MKLKKMWALVVLVLLIATDERMGQRYRPSPMERLSGRLKTAGHRISNALAHAGLQTS